MNEKKDLGKNPDNPIKKRKGLPKITPSPRSNPQVVDRGKFFNHHPIARETKFMPLNATNVEIVKGYFDSISPQIYQLIAASNQFALYQFEGKDYEIFLLPIQIARLVKNLTKDNEIKHAGIHFGYMRRKKTTTGFARAFFLSYEGGEFIERFIEKSAPELKKQLQIINIDEQGEKAFLYGSNIQMEHITSESSSLKKHKLIFVHNNQGIYLGLGLLRVQQARSDNIKTRPRNKSDDFSRSYNFILSILNLTDAGHYLRDGF